MLTWNILLKTTQYFRQLIEDTGKPCFREDTDAGTVYFPATKTFLYEKHIQRTDKSCFQ